MRRILRRTQRRKPTPENPLVVGIDLLLMQPAGANGGVKPTVYSFLAEIRRANPHTFRYVFFAQPELVPELEPMRQSHDVLLHAADNPPPLDVLYAPFGRSPLMRPDLPMVSLIVDLLHRDLPEALPIEEVNYRHEWFSQLAASQAHFQCISHYTASRLRHYYGVSVERCFVTHIPVHTRLAGAPAETAAANPIGRPFFLYPANSWPHKNHETLLRAYQDYKHTAGHAAWALVLTGHLDDRMRTLHEFARDLGLAEDVYFLGHVKDAEFARLWRSAGALVYPSLHEGFGIPLLEAMAFDCPVIASDTASLPEVGGDACLYIDPRRAESITAALRQLSSDAALRQRLVTAGRRWVRQFSLPKEAQKLTAALLELQ